MDIKRRLIRTEIKKFLLKYKDSIHCLVDTHIVQINSNINFDNDIKVSSAEIEAEIVLLEKEGFFEKDEKEHFKYYIRGNINKII